MVYTNAILSADFCRQYGGCIDLIWAKLSPAAPLIIWKMHHKNTFAYKKQCSNVGEKGWQRYLPYHRNDVEERWYRIGQGFRRQSVNYFTWFISKTQANSTDPITAVWSGSTLFATGDTWRKLLSKASLNLFNAKHVYKTTSMFTVNIHYMYNNIGLWNDVKYFP